MPVHRKLDPYALSRRAALEQARGDPRNQRLHQARSLAEFAPQALLYPLIPENLVLVVVFGLGQAAFDALLPGLWLAKLVPCALVVFLLEVVAHTAHGHGAPLRFTVDHLVSTAWRAVQAMVFVVGAVLLLIELARRDAPLATLAAYAACSLVLPAQLGLLAISDEFVAALDPRRWWDCVSAGGVAYAILVVLTAGALAGAAGVVPLWQAWLDVAQGVGLIAVDLAQVYLFFAAAHLLGAAFHVRREALGLVVLLQGKPAEEQDAESLAESVARVLALADEEEHHSRHDQAVALLATAPIGGHPPRPWLEALFEGACRRPKPYFAEAAGQRLIAQLVATQQWARALEVVVYAAQRWPRFQPAALDQRLLLAQHALERGDGYAFRQLTERLVELGVAPQAVDLGFLVARWCAERDDDAPAALAVLAPLLAQREHPTHRRIAALDAALRGAQRER